MKRVQFIFVFLFLTLITFFLFKEPALSDHTCYTSCGTPSSCPSPLVCSSGLCKNPSCLTQTDCTCDPYIIQGKKGKNGGSFPDSDPPFSNQTVTVTGQGNSSANPYSFGDGTTTLLGDQNYDVSVSAPSGSNVGYTLCYNKTDCHGTPPTSGASITTDSNRADSQNYVSGNHYVDLYWHFTPQTANCKNLTGPTTVFVGDQVNYQADYENENASLTNALMYSYSSSCPGSSLSNVSGGPGPGIYSFSWTPSATGSYTVYCEADAASANCFGYQTCVGSPPNYSCTGPTTSATVTVSNPGPWYKLKNTSLYKNGNIDINVAQNINKFTDGDSDDDGTRYIIIGNSGTATAQNTFSPGPPYNPISASGNNWYNNTYSFSQLFISNFSSYVRSRKQSVDIVALGTGSSLESSKVNFISGDQTITDANLTDAPTAFVLIVSGNVTVNNNLNSSSARQITIIATGQLTFSKTTQYANGIFIAPSIVIDGETPPGSDTIGLKIKGNLISSSTSTSNRNRTDNSRPSLFVVLDPDQYLSLLPLLSVSKYDWQQTQ